jgi:gamma-glutamyltranspeptidase
LDISTGRPVTLATRGMVTSPHSLASSAGVDVLRAGGSAIDAAIAASAVLAVVYPQIQLQLYSAMIDHGLDIQQAIEMPRFLSGRFALGEARDTLHMEGRFPPETISTLERRSHIVNRWEDWCEMAGHAHGITIDPRTSVLSGGSDPRSDGAAIGY